MVKFLLLYLLKELKTAARTVMPLHFLGLLISILSSTKLPGSSKKPLSS